MSKWFSGYAIEQEDREFLKSHLTKMSSALKSYAIPEMVDPWKLDERLTPTEDQLQIGSCQGQSLTDTAEYAMYVANGEIVQFSRMFAYLGSQKMDGISGDNGSTLSGGTKLVSQYGLCLESTYPYPRSYPSGGVRNVPQGAWDEAKRFLMKGALDIEKAEDIRQFIGSGAGQVQIGIAWGDFMEPKGGFITSFRPSGNFGGHAVVFAGYVPDSQVNKKSSAGYWLILKNSWSRRWGINGRAYVDPGAAADMLKHKFTVMVGRSDMGAPKPRPVPVDWTKPDKGMIA
jgi:C1A family cysteine protease